MKWIWITMGVALTATFTIIACFQIGYTGTEKENLTGKLGRNHLRTEPKNRRVRKND